MRLFIVVLILMMFNNHVGGRNESEGCCICGVSSSNKYLFTFPKTWRIDKGKVIADNVNEAR